MALWAVFAVAAIALVALSYFVGASYLAGKGEIVRGVEVGGVSLGGETPEEARSLLRERHPNLERVRVSGAGEEISLSTQELGIRYDVEGTLQNAYAVGREGNVLQNAGARAKGMFGAVEVPMEASYDEELAVSRVEQLDREIASEPRPVEISVGSDGEVQVFPAREGYEVDVGGTVRNVGRALESFSGEADLEGRPLAVPGISAEESEAAEEKALAATEAPAVLSGGGRQWELTPQEIARAIEFVPEGGELRLAFDGEALRSDLGDLFSELDSEAREADFEFEDGEVRVVPSQVGYELDERQMFEDLAIGLPEGRHKYEIPVSETGRPKFTTAEARELQPTEKLGEYRTRHTTPGNYNAPRVGNLRTASQELSGQTLAPGEVFSANDVLRPLDYNKANVFVGGKVEEAEGGGLCQVSSTLHMAANNSGMEVVERHPHSAMLDYIRPGLDATVWFGTGSPADELDMRFRNTTDGYVFIRQYVADDDYIYAEIWGQPTGEEVNVTSRPLYINNQSASWATRKKVERDGETIQDERVYTSTYGAIVEDGERQSPLDVRIASDTP